MSVGVILVISARLTVVDNLRATKDNIADHDTDIRVTLHMILAMNWKPKGMLYLATESSFHIPV